VLFLFVRAYVLRQEDLNAFVEWARGQKFGYFDLPRPREIRDVFLGELFWAPAYQSFQRPEYLRSDWTRRDDVLPRPVIVPGDEYWSDASSFDCSVDDSVRIRLPSEWLVEHMNLHWQAEECCYRDSGGTVVAQDPSVRDSGPSILLISRSQLEQFLAREDLALVWVIHGQKQALEGGTWKGQLDLSGVWTLGPTGPEGDMRASLRKRDAER
jgi:hypothetical protein